MQPYNAKHLLDTLCAEIDNILFATSKLKDLPNEVLLKTPPEGKWSVAEVLEHLNSYNRYYLPEIESALANQGGISTPPANFTPGWLGDYFTKSMYSAVPTKGEVTNKMKAPKDHRPSAGLDPVVVLDEFFAGTNKLKSIMQANNVDLARVKIPISLAKWVKIRLGDTYRFLVAHKVRHFVQVKNALAATQA